MGKNKANRNWREIFFGDTSAGVLSGLIAFGLYFWSCAPNVTLLDSGEFAVAAIHFGVPHPTGYPLWTLLTWIFQLIIPFGNAMWRVNLCSAFCAALAVGFCATLISDSLRRLLTIAKDDEENETAGKTPSHFFYLPSLIAISFSLMLACSLSMWTQAVIAEVYALHALVVVIFLRLLFIWTRNPGRDAVMLAAFLVLALGFSNHQLCLALAPLPFIFILLLRPRDFPDWLWAALWTAGLVYLGFATLSPDPKIFHAAVRFLFILAGASIVFLAWRRWNVKWHLVFLLPLVVAGGLAPHVYMPVASSTNPPMNWAYTRDAGGFYFSVNRSQYSNPLSQQSLRALGPLTGITQKKAPSPYSVKTFDTARDWSGFFGIVLAENFTLLGIIGYFASILLILRFPLPQRVWIYGLHLAFALAAFLQPIFDGAQIDVAGWWVQMPYHTYTKLIFAVLAATGMGLLLMRVYTAWCRRTPRISRFLVPATCLLLFLPLVPFFNNEKIANQRERWFGWEFGHDMLADLPQGAVVIGGTDPGRFVPTYMIFGESSQPAKFKRDSDFDRRDLYIITQNALGEKYYMRYLRDQYTDEKPKVRTSFERWLRRENIYPEKPLILPSEAENKAIAERSLSPEFLQKNLTPRESPDALVYAEVLRWIWERNRDQHEFFIEESFPIRWSYDYAVPHGLVYRLAKEKVEILPREIIEKDFAYWAAYKKKLLDNPKFEHDLDARHSFSKLRHTTGNIYQHHNLAAEAETAYKEALELYPAYPDALLSLCEIFWKDARYEEAEKYILAALEQDPRSVVLFSLGVNNERRKEYHARIATLEAILSQNPLDSTTIEKLANIYLDILDDTPKAVAVINAALAEKPTDIALLRALARLSEKTQDISLSIHAYQALVEVAPTDALAHYFLARKLLLNKQPEAAQPSLQRAQELGGARLQEMMQNDPVFNETNSEK